MLLRQADCTSQVPWWSMPTDRMKYQIAYHTYGEGNGTQLQYSCLENPWTEEPGRLHADHGVTNSQTWLSNFTFAFYFHALEKEIATHSSVLAWRILGTGKPGGLPSMGSHRVGHDWSDLAAAAAPARVTGTALLVQWLRLEVEDSVLPLQGFGFSPWSGN